MLNDGLIKYVVLIAILSAISIVIPFSLYSLDAIYFLIILIYAIEIAIIINLCFKLISTGKKSMKLTNTFENPLMRKIRMLNSAIEGSAIARKMLSYSIKDIIETNVNAKISQENCYELIKEKEVIALIYPEENEDYLKGGKTYLNALNKFYKLIEKEHE